MRNKEGPYSEGWTRIRAPFAQKDDFPWLIVYSLFFPGYLWHPFFSKTRALTTCKLRTYDDKLVFFGLSMGQNRKTILYSQIIFFETAKLVLGFSILKRICYKENGKKHFVEFMYFRSDGYAAALRRHLPGKEKEGVLL
jgi:hypothetical protein